MRGAFGYFTGRKVGDRETPRDSSCYIIYHMDVMNAGDSLGFK
jgi:hypothetical protein